MPIMFEEVTAEVEREPREAAPAPAAGPAPTEGEDFRGQLERELRLMREREHRLCAD